MRGGKGRGTSTKSPRLAECNNALFDTYRFDKLGFLYSVAERITIEDLA